MNADNYNKVQEFLRSADALGDSAIQFAGAFLAKGDDGVAIHDRRRNVEDQLNLTICKLQHLQQCIKMTDRF